ncbi:hypothetical protein HDZ31DRAFT_78397, partial [Schizophyllum fasciatum]
MSALGCEVESDVMSVREGLAGGKNPELGSPSPLARHKMRGASSIRYMLRSGGTRLCTLLILIVLGTLYFPSFPPLADDKPGTHDAPAADVAASPARGGRHRCPAPRTAHARAPDHARQTCVPLAGAGAAPAFAVALCVERDAYDAFTLRVRRADARACARAEARGPRVDDGGVRRLVRERRGPDTFWLRVDGAERLGTQESVYEGGCAYRFDVRVRNAGDLYVDLWHAYE